METTAAAGQHYPAYAQSPPPSTDTGGRHVGVPCLMPALRNERMPKDFKGPRKLGRLKRKVQDMGELMDTLTKYVESDDTKDPGEDDDKVSTARRGESSKGHSEFQGRGNHNHAGPSKRRQQEGATDFVANKNAGNGNQ
ncbi:hypothetical protein ZWY2020_032222 [Hordeum vulgare]|nr:hypothetical protein ZWY2020_032222 [Hordeum vulgare]